MSYIPARCPRIDNGKTLKKTELGVHEQKRLGTELISYPVLRHCTKVFIEKSSHHAVEDKREESLLANHIGAPVPRAGCRKRVRVQYCLGAPEI